MKKHIVLFLSVLVLLLSIEILRLNHLLNTTSPTAQAPPEKIEKTIPNPVPIPIDKKQDRYFSHKYVNKAQGWDVRFGTSEDTITFADKYLVWNGGKSIPYFTLQQLVRKVFKKLPHIKTTNNNVQLLVETIITESDGGRINVSKWGDYGPLQMKVYVANELRQWLKTNHKDVHKAIMGLRNSDWNERDNLCQNIPYAIAMGITEYWRKAGGEYWKHIDTLEKRAIMWKSVYNTSRGLGTVRDYMQRSENYKRQYMASN